MILFSQKTEDQSNVNQLLDKQQNGFVIEALVANKGISYLEATTEWLEENSIPESSFNRYIPQGIVEKIMSEAIDDNMLRPSISKTQKTNTLDFLL